MSRLVKNLLFLLMAILLVMATAHAQEDTPTENCLPKGVTCQPTIGFDNSESAGKSVEYRYAFEQSISWFEEDGQQSHRGSKQAAKQRVASGLLTVVKFRRQSCEMAARVSVDAGTHERLPDLRFAISGGRIRAVCLGADESAGSSAASLNLQRGLLSMLQTSARDFHLPKSLVETDILGDCATHFVATGPNSFRKTKQLQECRGVNRFATVGPRISSWFSGVSPDSSRRLVTGHQQCDTSLHPIHGSINLVNCSEKLSLNSPLPASFGSPVKLEIRTSLRLIDRRSASVQPSTMLSKISRRTSLSYENDDELDAESPRDDVESLQSVLTSLCNQSKVRNPAVLVMNLGKLVSKVRYPEPLELLHRWLTTSLKCSNLRLARWQYLKTLVQADMDAGIVAIFRLLADKSIGGGLPIVGPDRQNILKILAIQAASSKFPLSTAVIISAVDFFKTCLTSSNSKASCSPEDVGPAMLAVSAVARRTKAAERSAELESSLTTLLTGFSEGDDKINGKNQRHLTDWALLAIGNLGPDWATQAVTSVAASTVEAARHSTGRRLLAVAALQNMQPSALAVSALERLLMSGALISSSDGRRLQAAIVRALLPRLEKGTCPTNRNCPTSLSTAIERLWNSSNPADAALATYAHSVARKRLEKLESSLSQDSALKSDAALRQLRQLVEKPPALFSIDRASKPSVRADRFQLVDGLIDISYEIDWESADAVIISMPTRAEFQLTLHNQMTGFAVPLLDAELIRRFSNGPGDHTAVIRRRGDVTVAVDWTGESSIGDLQRLLWDDTWMSATIESVLMPTTLQVTTSLGQALLISSEAALIANSGVSRRPPSVTESFRTDGSVMLQPSFSVYASRSVHLSGLSMGRRSSRSSVIHRLGISGDGDLSVELFWRWQTSDGWGLSVGLRSPLQRQELLRVRLMSVLAEGKNDAKNPVFNDTWISENQDDISSRQSWQLCMRAFSRTITGHNICASVKKQRQWSKFSLILERQDPKAELFEATLEKKTTETMSETKIVFGNRNSPQRHFGLTINSLNTSEGSFLKFDASNPVFPVSLNSSLQAGGGIAAAQLLAGSQSYSFLGNWSRNSSDWRLTGDVSRVDRSWQRFGLDLVSDAVSGTDQLTVRFPNGSRRINSLDGDFGSLTLARTLRLRASDFEAAVSARLTESGSNETASARFGISGGRVSNGSSDKLVFVQSTEARQLGVGWMRHRLETSVSRAGIENGLDGVFRPAPLESFNLDVRFIRSPSGMRIYKETDGIAFNIKHYWPALTSLNQSLRLTIDTQRFREPKHSKNAIYFQQSLLHLPENRGLTHQISADGSLVPRNFSLTNQLSWLAYRRGFFKLVSLFELNGKCLFRMKQQVELAENYSASASTWWHRVGYALTVETPNNSHLLRSGGLKISTQAAVDDATVKAARQLVRADFVAIDRASANAVTAAFLRQLWQLLSTVRARQNMTFSLGNSLLASVQTDIDAVDLRLLHRHVLQKGWGSSQVLLDVRVLKLQRQVQATLEVAGRGELRAKLSNWPAERASVQFELRSYVSGRQGLLTADWNLSSRTASILIKATSPTTGASAGNFNFSGAINLSVGSLRLLAEQPNIRARQRLEISWPKLGSMRLDFERTSIDNRWGPDIHLAVERPSSGGRLTFLLNTSEPKIEQIGLDYRSSDVAEGYAATVRYVRYGHEFRADARGRGGVTFNGASNQLPLFNLTVEQALDLYGLEDAAPFSDIAKQLRLSARLIATRRGEVDLAWWLTSPVSAFGLEPVVGWRCLLAGGRCICALDWRRRSLTGADVRRSSAANCRVG
uniref:Vitellogenin domain-containing protein n=1 Tax=Macrostomum lignano TaxID=282301 RepID=A0A1I8HRU8_9PLAT